MNPRSTEAMFLEYYGLREQPFGVTPNPRYVYECPGFREAYANLSYAVESNLGFAALFAEPGMGKTTMLIALLGKYGQDRPTAFISHTQCSSTGMLRMLLKDLEIETADRDPVALVEELKQVLVRSEPGKRPLIVIDEAQNLDHTTLETLRLLSNIESADSKLLNIILAGQLQFARKLLHPDLEQLKQRIAVVARLTRLTPAEVASYISHRLLIAGCEGRPLFTPRVMNAIAAQSGGIPRQVNRICFNALSLACAMGKPQVDDDVLREVQQDLRLVSASGQGGAGAPPPHAPARPVEAPAVHRAPAPPPPPMAAPVPPPQFAATPAPPPHLPVAPTSARSAIGFRDAAATARAAVPPVAAPPLDYFGRPAAQQHPAFTPRSAQVEHQHEPKIRRPNAAAVFRPAWNRWNYRVLAICAVTVIVLFALAVAVTRMQSVPAAVAGFVAPIFGSSEPSTSAAPEAPPPPAGAVEAQRDANAGSSEQKQTRAPATVSRSRAPQPAAEIPADSIALTINLPPNTASTAAPPAKQVAQDEPAPPSLAASARPDAPITGLYLPAKSPDAIITAPPVSKLEPPVALKQPAPRYPQIAKTARIEGAVVLEAVVGRDGEVGDVRVLSGPPVLAQAAMDAVKQWKYKPATSNGEAVESPIRLEFKFVP